MKILCFIFHQNRIINEEFDFFLGGEREGPPGGKGASIHEFLSQLFLVNMKISCLKFHTNRTMNEEFDFWGVKTPPSPEGGQDGSDFKKSKKPHTEQWPQLTTKISAF